MDMLAPVLGTVLVYGSLFLIFKFVMNLMAFYRAMPERHQIEWLMRMVATINGSACGLLSIPLVFGDYETIDIRLGALLCQISLGYFIYDTMGNIFYFRLLKKRYILFHHTFCFVMGTHFVISGHMMPAIVGLWALLPDPVDHILWFLHRLNFPHAPRKFVDNLNTIFFIVNRLVFGNYILLRSLFIDDVAFQLHPIEWNFSAFGVIVFLGMNLYVTKGRLFKSRRGQVVAASPMTQHHAIASSSKRE